MSETIPVVDLNGDARSVVQQIDRAACDYGFFQVVNHDVTVELLARVWQQTRMFFSLPRDAKHALSRTRENPRGYYDRELTKNARDLKEVFDYAGSGRAAVDGVNQWPGSQPAFRLVMSEYFGAITNLGHVLLERLCSGLGIQRDSLRRHFDPVHTSFVRLNYYPIADPLEPEESQTAAPLGDMALHHHTDSGALTILLQDDVGGLQVQVDDAWVDVVPVDGAFVINVGDMMQVWSNDRYVAALHRVLPRTDCARYSLPFFFNPSYDTQYAPLGTAPPRYRAINWGAFRQARTDGDFADYGHEIQISDFRLP